MLKRFEVLDVALAGVAALGPLVDKMKQSDKDLACQLRRAASSVPMCIAEGAERAGRDRVHLYRVAAGSAAEVRTALSVAVAWGYVDAVTAGGIDALFDRVAAMLYRLTHVRRGP